MAFFKQAESKPFFIGRAGGQDFWTNMALSHDNGTIRNERLMEMGNEELERLWIDGKTVFFEEYRRPDDKKLADKQGGEAGEVYKGTHRAKIILDFREMKMRDNFRLLKQEDIEALEQLALSDSAKGLNKLRDELIGKKIIGNDQKKRDPDWCEKHHRFLIECDCFDKTSYEIVDNF